MNAIDEPREPGREYRKAGVREWAGLAVLLLPLLLIAMDGTILFLALPAISEDLRPSPTEELWVMDAYGFALAGLLVPMGALADRIGRRRILMMGAAAFGGASLLGAMSDSAELLIFARGVLGIAGATLMPSTMGLLRTIFEDPGERRVALAIWTGGLSAGAALGPVVGGALLETFTWHAVFLVNLPLMTLLLVSAPFLLPETPRQADQPFDVLGAAMAMVGTLLLIWGLKELAIGGLRPLPAAAAVIGIGVLTAFVRHLRRSPAPMLDLALFRNRAFNGACSTNIVAMAALTGSGLFASQFLQVVLGYSPLEAGLWLLPTAVAVGVTATAATKLATRVRPAWLVVAGFVLIAVGMLGLLAAAPDHSVLSIVVPAAAVAGGMGFALPVVADLVLGAAPPERAGTASAVSEMASQLGGALGIAVLGSVGAAVYRASMPADAPRSALDTLGGAESALDGLSGTARAALQAASHGAFTDGLHAMAIAGAAFVLAGAVVIARMLRSVPAAEATGDRAVAHA